MGRRFRKLEPYMWRKPAVRRLDTDTKLVWAYLLSCPYQVLCPGLIVASEMMIAEDLFGSQDAEPEELVRDLVRVQHSVSSLQAEGFIKIDKSARVIVVLRAVSHNMPDNPNIIKGWFAALKEVPDCDLRHEWLRGAYAQLAEEFGVSDRRAKMLADALSGDQQPLALVEPSGGQESEPSQEDTGEDTDPELAKLTQTVRTSEHLGEAFRLVDFMAEEIKRETPQWKATYKRIKWVVPMEAMLRLDKRPAREVAEIIRWAVKDDFWSGNILSPATLRKQYVKLYKQKQRGSNEPKTGNKPEGYKHGKSLREEIANAE